MLLISSTDILVCTVYSCGPRMKLRRNWRSLYRIFKSPWMAHWPYFYGFG